MTDDGEWPTPRKDEHTHNYYKRLAAMSDEVAALWYEQIPPLPHLTNPYCDACDRGIPPCNEHESYCYNKIPF